MIKPFWMWLSRRVLQVKWTEKRAKEWVQEQVGMQAQQRMLQGARKRKIRKFGHWKRRGESVVLAPLKEKAKEEEKKKS